MKIIDNVSELFGEDLKAAISNGDRMSVAAASFSIHAFAALESALRTVDSFDFVFTGPSFVTDHGNARAAHREFIIPPVMSGRDLAGTPFEIRLRNQMTSRAVARECAAWIRAKGRFKANPGSPIPAFLCTRSESNGALYTGLHGFTAADLGYQPGNLTMINKIDEEQAVARYAGLFEQLWNERDRLTDVTDALCRQLEQVSSWHQGAVALLHR
jgi:hypothetical protein